MGSGKSLQLVADLIVLRLLKIKLVLVNSSYLLMLPLPNLFIISFHMYFVFFCPGFVSDSFCNHYD